MEVNFWIEKSASDKTLAVEIKLVHNIDRDEIYSTGYKVDVTNGIELSMFREILDMMEREASRHAAERTSVYSVDDYNHVTHLQKKIRHLEDRLQAEILRKMHV